MKDNYENKSHIKYKRVFKQMKGKKIYKKRIGNCLKYIKRCHISKRNNLGIPIYNLHEKII